MTTMEPLALASFASLQAHLRENPEKAVFELLEAWRALLLREPGREPVASWHRFVRARSHQLRRDAAMLLPLALAEPEGSIVGREARLALAQSPPEHPWLRWRNARPVGARVLTVPPVHVEYLGFALAVHPEGRQVALATGRRISLIDTPTGRILREVGTHADRIAGLAFAPDGSWLVSGAGDKALSFWDLAATKPRTVANAHRMAIRHVAVCDDGERVVVLSERSGGAKVWNAKTARAIVTLESVPEHPRGLALLPGNRAAISADGAGLGVWDLAAGKRVGQFDPDPSLRGWGSTVAYDPVSGRLYQSYGIDQVHRDEEGWTAWRSRDGVVFAWDAASGRRLATLRAESRGHALSLATHPDGRTLFCGTSEGTIEAWDTEAFSLRAAVDSSIGDVSALAWAGDELLSAGGGGTLCAWDLSREEPAIERPRVSHITTHPTRPLAFTDGGGGWSYNRDSGAHTHWSYDAAGLKCVDLEGKTPPRPLGAMFPIELVADGTRVVARVALPHEKDSFRAPVFEHIGVWDVATGRELARHEREWPENWLCVVHPDGEYALWVGDGKDSPNGVIDVWSLTTGKTLRTLAGHAAPIRSLHCHPDGARLLSHDPHTLRLWHIESGRELRVFAPPAKGAGKDGLIAPRISPDGTRVAVLHGRVIHIFRLDTGDEEAVIKTGKGQQALAYHPDGARLITLRDNQISIWSAHDGKLLHAITSPVGQLFWLRVHPDGDGLITLGGRMETEAWSLETLERVCLSRLNAGSMSLQLRAGIPYIAYAQSGTDEVEGPALQVLELGSGRTLGAWWTDLPGGPVELGAGGEIVMATPLGVDVFTLEPGAASRA